MIGIRFPLEIIDGDLVLDETPSEIVLSEIKAIISTRLGERVYRQDYGTPNFLLKKLDLGKVIAELSLALENNLAPLGFSQIIVEVDSPLADIQRGLINLVVNFSVNSELFNFTYSVQL
jgi:hypothetical protein